MRRQRRPEGRYANPLKLDWSDWNSNRMGTFTYHRPSIGIPTGAYILLPDNDGGYNLWYKREVIAYDVDSLSHATREVARHSGNADVLTSGYDQYMRATAPWREKKNKTMRRQRRNPDHIDLRNLTSEQLDALRYDHPEIENEIEAELDRREAEAYAKGSAKGTVAISDLFAPRPNPVTLAISNRNRNSKMKRRRRNPHQLSYLMTRQGFPGTMSDDDFLEQYDNAMIDVENSALDPQGPDAYALSNAVALLIEMKNRPHLRTDPYGKISQATLNDMDRRQDLDVMLNEPDQNPRRRRLKRHY